MANYQLKVAALKLGLDETAKNRVLCLSSQVQHTLIPEWKKTLMIPKMSHVITAVRVWKGLGTKLIG